MRCGATPAPWASRPRATSTSRKTPRWTGIRSYEAWYFLASLPAGMGRVGLLDATGSAPSLTLFYLHTDNVGREIRFDVGAGANKLVVVQTITLGAWHHLAQVCSDTGVLVAYLDGAEVGRSLDGACTATTVGTAGIFIGQDNNGGNPAEQLTGMIDDVRVWTRALTPADIAQSARVP